MKIAVVMLMALTAHAETKPTLVGKEKQIEGCKFALQSLREKGFMVRESTETVVCNLEMSLYKPKK